MNIPVYRAKEIDSEEYVEGYVTYGINQTSILTPISRFGEFTIWKIDPLTLAIHFPDMLDREGNKIFASLSEDGKGGDIIEHTNILTKDKILLTASYHKAKGEFGAYSKTHYIRSMKLHLAKIMGVQK